MAIRLMVDRYTYCSLVSEGSVAGIAVNEVVSTSRHDPCWLSHTYETRRSLVRSALARKGAGDVVANVFDDAHLDSPIRAKVMSVGPLVDDGIRFHVALSAGGGHD